MGDEVTSCFPQEGSNICAAYNNVGQIVDIGSAAPAETRAIDPELSWEVQKFLVTWTYIYLPENQMATWRDYMRMYSTPALTSDTEVDDYLLFYNPNGNTYLAKQFGQEVIFGKTVEKGVSARVLQYANELLNKAYVTTPVYASDGETVIGYQAQKDTDGEYIVRFDSTLSTVTPEGYYGSVEGCTSETDNLGCTCEMNRSCMELQNYISMIDWLAAWSGFAEYNTDGWDDMIGIYG